MSRKEIDASAALERILVTYGFKQQKELAEHLGIHGNNVSSWLARNTIPSNVFLECALDTGADLHWLCYGEFANASCGVSQHVGRGKELYDEIMANGGKPVLRRIMDAYGFTLQKQLCDLLEISSGTVSTWVRRDYFPGDVVVTCALDTGVSLEWLATGKGVNDCHNKPLALIPTKRLIAGVLEDVSDWNANIDTLADEKIISPLFIIGSRTSWLVETNIRSISNGCWLLSIDGKFDIYQASLLPGKRVNLSNDRADFTCGSEDVLVGGKVIVSFEKHI